VLSVHVQSIIPECIAVGKISEGYYLPNRVTAYGPDAEISHKSEIPDFFATK